MTEKQAHILCLDDQPLNLRVRKVLLEQFGCSVVAVHDAQSCLAAATRDQFDLALLDYHLGGEITGEDVARDLRICSPQMILVMLTGDPNIPLSAKECVDAVLIKGLSNPGELLETLQRLLPRHRIKQTRKPLSPEHFFGFPSED